MLLFWVFVAITTLLVTGALVRPLLRRQPTNPDEAADGDEQRLEVFRDRRREIERELASGRLSPAEAKQAQRDLLRQLATDLPPSPGPVVRDTGKRMRSIPGLTACALLVVVPASALLVYRQVGTPAMLEPRPAATMASPRLPPGHPTTTSAPSLPGEIETLVAGIEQRTREAPEDGEAWAMLGAALKMQGRHQDAVLAFEKAIERVEPDARLFAEAAESIARVAGGSFEGRPTEMLERALALDPAEPRALWLMAAAQFRAGDLPRARQHLTRLRDGLPATSADAAEVGRILERIDARMAGSIPVASAPSPTSVPTAAPTTSSGAARPGPAQAVPEALAAIVAGTVVVDPRLAAQAERGGTLFVIARQADGPPIPVAVRREPGASLPMPFELGDANAMDPSRLLSSAGPLTLEARLSRSGEARRQAGDLYGLLASVEPGRTDLRIVIDRVVTSGAEAGDGR
ncbi:MAG: c-type cytochrome biogenesis protein CcmI [Burkholderiaceae bacterium]|nr:c-type cytochrome biogenesis protein CcmI [Burkholderiaceae bacterium]